MRVSKFRTLTAWYGVTGSIRVYTDGSARLRIMQNGKKIHDKIHKSEKAALSAWYRANN